MTPDPARRRGVTVLPDGRRLAFLQHGAPDGQPVLMFHDILQGIELTRAFAEACLRKNWRIIAFSRPGYGESDPNPGVEGARRVASICRDAAALLGSLEYGLLIDLAFCRIVGHGLGSLFASHFCRYQQRYAQGLLLLSHAAVKNGTDPEGMTGLMRLLSRPGNRYADAHPVIARSGISLIESGQPDLFLRAVYGSDATDADALRRPEVREAATSGLLHAFQQGPGAWCADLSLDPGDCSTPPAGAQALVIPGTGQLALHTHWPRVLEGLARLPTE